LRSETKPKVKNAAPGAKYKRAAVEKTCGQYLVGGMRAKREQVGRTGNV